MVPSSAASLSMNSTESYSYLNSLTLQAKPRKFSRQNTHIFCCFCRIQGLDLGRYPIANGDHLVSSEDSRTFERYLGKDGKGRSEPWFSPDQPIFA
jgi:hypothetical protein